MALTPFGQAAYVWAGRSLVAFGVLLSASRASAQTPLGRAKTESGALTMAEVGVGTLFLPAAPDCLPGRTCLRNDTALLLTARPLVQIGGRFVFGVGASWGIGRRSQSTDILSASGRIERTHHRDYFFFSPIVRYYPLLSFLGRVDAYVGLTGGVVIVSDRYSNDEDGTSSVGPTALTVSTTGTTGAIGAGFEVRLTEAISAGAWTNQAVWSLPKNRECAQTYECATLGDRRFAVEGGLTVSYRLRL